MTEYMFIDIYICICSLIIFFVYVIIVYNNINNDITKRFCYFIYWCDESMVRGMLLSKP